METRRIAVLLGAAATFFAGATVAPPTASSAPSWRNVTGNTGTNLTAVQLARGGATGTGPLHVVWEGPQGDVAGSVALFERAVLGSGALGPVHTLLGGTGGLTNPGIARNPADGTMWVYSAGASVLGGKLFAISSTDGFATTSGPTAISQSGYAYAPDDASAAFTQSGSAFQTFGATLKLGLGEDPTEDVLTEAPGIDSGRAGTCCVYWSHLAIDAKTDEAVVGWFSNSGDATPPRAGIEVVSLTTGTTGYAPGSANAARTASSNGDMATPITGRMGADGIYVGYCSGYPTCVNALVWRRGTPKPQVVATGARLDHVRIAAAPGGRLWAMWYRSGRLWARRSDAAATAWGAPVSVIVPGGGDADVWRLAGDASRGPLDAFVTELLGSVNATHTTRLLPGLTLAGAVKAPTGTKLVFTVTDAGVPVAGAKVALRGATGKTNALGKASLVVTGKPGMSKVTAGAGGFTGATRTIKVIAG